VIGTEEWGFCGEDCKSRRDVYDSMVRLTYSGRILKASDSYPSRMRSVLIGVTRMASKTLHCRKWLRTTAKRTKQETYDVRNIVCWCVKRVTTDFL